jgi:hypothetical protein
VILQHLCRFFVQGSISMRVASPRLAVILVLGLGSAGLSAHAAADDPPKGRLRAPGDSQILSSNRRGAYFISRALKDSHDQLLHRLAALRSEINEARIQPAEARRRLDALTGELAVLRKKIDQAKLYIPGADVHQATATETINFENGGYLLIDAGQVEIRGWDQPSVRCVLEKSVLSDGPKDVSMDLSAIRVTHRMVAGKDLFGYYKNIQGKAEFQAEWDRFLFKDFLDREFLQVRVAGLAHDEGNTQLPMEMKNEEGSGITGSEWKRQAKLVVFVPNCKRLAVRGGLAGFKVDGLDANLVISGDGDRDYDAKYEISNVRGSITSERIPLHRVSNITGDVRIDARPFVGNVSTTNDDRGITMEPGEMGRYQFQDILGNLQARFSRGDLSIGGITGRVDVENDFGRVAWLVDRPIAKLDHRLTSQGGTIEVHLAENMLNGLPLNLFTESGIVHMDPGMGKDLESPMFTGLTSAGILRGWHGFATKTAAEAKFDLRNRLNNALEGHTREPGVDVLTLGGTILLSAPVR